MFIIKLIILNRYKISLEFIGLFLESELVSGFMTEHSSVVFVFFFLAEYASIVLMCILISIFFLGGSLPITDFIYYLTYFFESIISFIFYIPESYRPYIDYFMWYGLDIDKFYGLDIVKFYDLMFENIIIKNFVYLLFLICKFLFTIVYLIVFFIPDSTRSLIDVLNCIINDPTLEGWLCSLSLGLKSCVMIYTFILVRASQPRIRFDQLMSFCWTTMLPVVFAFIILVPCILYSFDLFPVNISIY